MKTIKNLKNIKGKRILVRVDFNVPIKNGKVLDDFRIKKALPTIKFLQKKGVKITLITHLGKDGEASLEPVIDRFFKLSKMKRSEISFFKNVRKFPVEEKNDPAFSKKLAALGDIFVNEAFSVSHRKHASVVGIPKYLPSYAGLQLETEVKNLSKVIKNPKHPFLFILGGAKFSTKIPLIEKYLKLADNLFIGGALLNDLLKAKGYEVGESLVDDSKGIEKFSKNKKLILPIDVLVQSGNKLINKKINEVQKNEIILDLGRETTKRVEDYVKKAKLILWNGPLGKYEDGGDVATKKILKTVSLSKAESVIGGGDIVSLVSKMKMENKFTLVSTGGGATLDFLANGTLPGIKALK